MVAYIHLLTKGRFYTDELTVILEWVSNYILYKLVKFDIKLLSHCRTSTVKPLKFLDGYICSKTCLAGLLICSIFSREKSNESTDQHGMCCFSKTSVFYTNNNTVMNVDK